MSDSAIDETLARPEPSSHLSLPDLLRRAVQPEVIDLAMGIDRSPPPADLVDAAIAALRGGEHQYIDSRGLAPLRQAAARSLSSSSKVPVDPDMEVTVTAGTTGGLFSILAALHDRGDEVVLLDPGYAQHARAAEAAGARVVRVAVEPPGWSLDLARLESAICSATRSVVISNPCNPTGVHRSNDELRAISRICARHGSVLIVDEVYGALTFDGHFESSWALRASGADIVCLNSLSKSHRVGGWRVGLTFAPAPLTRRLRLIHEASTLGAPTPLQYGALAAFDDQPVDTASLQAAHDRLYRVLARLDVEPLEARAGIFFLADVSKTMQSNDHDFVEWLFERAGVLVAPGRLFFADPTRGASYVRICAGKSRATMDDAMRRLNALARSDEASRTARPR